MYTLKGFIQYASFVDNTPDQIAVFGELSTDASTYAKDKRYYIDQDAPLTTLVAFHSIRDDEDTEVDAFLAKRALELSHYLFSRAQQGLIGDNPQALVQSVLAEFPGIVTEFSIGDILEDGDVFLPEWISYKDGQFEDDNRITLWFADESFRRQYDEYAIEVIPPFLPLDDFFLDPAQVQVKLNRYDFPSKISESQTARGEYPYTYMLVNRYNYRDPENHDFQVPTYWIVLIYGQAGNNPDIIKNALIDFIMGQTTHTREEWADILPDLFITTEFIITPFWSQYAIPNRLLLAGIYSPYMNPGKHLPQIQAMVKGPMYTNEWVRDQYELSVALYKSLGFGVVGNPDNRDELYHLSDVFPDYILVTNDSADFNRMTPTTQEWLVKFNELLVIAESLRSTSSVPFGYAKVLREGVLYAAMVYDNITYLVASKDSHLAVYPEEI